jgi:hypothetical protein
VRGFTGPGDKTANSGKTPTHLIRKAHSLATVARPLAPVVGRLCGAARLR